MGHLLSLLFSAEKIFYFSQTTGYSWLSGNSSDIYRMAGHRAFKAAPNIGGLGAIVYKWRHIICQYLKVINQVSILLCMCCIFLP